MALWVTAILAVTLGALLLVQYRRHAQAKQAAGEAANLREALDHLAEGIAMFDADARLVAWNSRYLSLLGLSAQNVERHMTLDAIARLALPITVRLPSGEERRAPLSSADLRAHSSFDLEGSTPDGATLRVQGRAMPNGNYILTYADVTDLRLSELAYREQATRLSLILDNVVDAIVTINESGSIESWSKGAERVFGYKSEEVLRRNVRMLMPEPYASAHDGYIRRYRQTGERRIIGTRRELEALRRDGRRIPVDIGISELKIGERRIFIGIVRDISERLEIERLKSSFVATVSHELRTPLTSISGSLGLLVGGVAGELPPKAARLIEIAKQNSDRLVRLINDILDLEKAESGRLAFELQAQQIKPIVAYAIDANRAFAQGLGVTIVLEPNSEDAVVLADRDRFVQVMTNLLSNAAKFSPRGGVVRVRIEVVNDMVRIAVHDDGPGIPPQFQARIFERFAQADSSDSRVRAGTGLGLSIAKTIVERLGGNIDFESAPQRGTTFYVQLPIRHQPTLLQAKPHAALTGKSPGPAVLVCEDDPDVAALLAGILRQDGMRAQTVDSARAARAALKAVKFDLVIVDLHLPDIDGLEFIAELRAQEHTRSLPVIVVTASARTDADAGALSAMQLADWLQKPVEAGRLLEAIRRGLSQAEGRRARILYVEDDVSLTQFVERALRNEAEVVTAGSLAQARERLEDGVYDLVILDIGLGDGSGLDILPLLGRNGPQPQVILYSASQASSELAARVQAALVKSRDSVESLLSSIRSLVQRDVADTAEERK